MAVNKYIVIKHCKMVVHVKGWCILMQGPLARLMALFVALWAWLKGRFDAVFTHTSNSSSAASA